MKKNLLVMIFVLLFSLLLTSSLIASPKNGNMLPNRIANSLNTIKSKIPSAKGKKIEAIYKNLLIKCVNSTAWTCAQAMAHFDESVVYAVGECDAYGWESDYCGEQMTWLEDTWAWAMRRCAASPELAFIILKPKEIMIGNSKMPESSEKRELGR